MAHAIEPLLTLLLIPVAVYFLAATLHGLSDTVQRYL